MKRLGSLIILASITILVVIGVPICAQIITQERPRVTTATHSTEVDMTKNVYDYIQQYRSTHNGKYPSDGSTLMVDMINHFQKYGFTNAKDAMFAMVSPDNKLSDINSTAYKFPEKFMSYTIYDQRPDSNVIGSPLLQGEKDIVATTNIYRFYNTKKIRKQGKCHLTLRGMY